MIARKAKSILDDDDDTVQPRETPEGRTFQASDRSKKGQVRNWPLTLFSAV